MTVKIKMFKIVNPDNILSYFGAVFIETLNNISMTHVPEISIDFWHVLHRLKSLLCMRVAFCARYCPANLKSYLKKECVG